LAFCRSALKVNALNEYDDDVDDDDDDGGGGDEHFVGCIV